MEGPGIPAAGPAAAWRNQDIAGAAGPRRQHREGPRQPTRTPCWTLSTASTEKQRAVPVSAVRPLKPGLEGVDRHKRGRRAARITVAEKSEKTLYTQLFHGKRERWNAHRHGGCGPAARSPRRVDGERGDGGTVPPAATPAPPPPRSAPRVAAAPTPRSAGNIRRPWATASRDARQVPAGSAGVA